MEQRDRTFFEYCCKDSCVTYEISEHLDNKLKGASLEHYRLNIALLNPLLDMEMRGIRYDIEGAASRRALLQTKMYEAQARLNALTGYCFDWKSLAAIRQHATELMSKKKGGILKPYIEAAERLNNLVTMPNPSLASIGEIEDLLDKSLNVGSTSFRDYLYTTLQLPPQYNEDERKTKSLPLTTKPSLNYLSILVNKRKYCVSSYPTRYPDSCSPNEARNACYRRR